MRIGIDLGGTKIEGIALADDGSELQRLRVPTPRDYDGSLHAIGELVRRLEAAAPSGASPVPVGVGIPGTEDGPDALIKNANSTWLIGRPLRRDLENVLGRPVRLMNDANCFALSEATDGAGRDAHVVFGVILGTGVGGGIVVGGQCLIGPNGIAGEWGHNPLPWPGDADEPLPDCYCGRRGCIETYLSGPGMQRDHTARTGDELSPGEIVQQAAAGDEAAAITLRLYHDRLGRALASVVNVLDPMSSSSAAACPIFPASRRRHSYTPAGMSSRVRSTRGSAATSMAIPAASAVRPGCGRFPPAAETPAAAVCVVSGYPFGRQLTDNRVCGSRRP